MKNYQGWVNKEELEHLQSLCVKLFEALDDELKFCVSNRLEISGLTVNALHEAQDAGIGTSEALRKCVNDNEQ